MKASRKKSISVGRTDMAARPLVCPGWLGAVAFLERSMVKQITMWLYSNVVMGIRKKNVCKSCTPIIRSRNISFFITQEEGSFWHIFLYFCVKPVEYFKFISSGGFSLWWFVGWTMGGVPYPELLDEYTNRIIILLNYLLKYKFYYKYC